MKCRKQFLTTMGVRLTGITLGKNPVQLEEDDLPLLEFAFTAYITLGKVHDLGMTPYGHRHIIPTAGGTLEGGYKGNCRIGRSRLANYQSG